MKRKEVSTDPNRPLSGRSLIHDKLFRNMGQGVSSDEEPTQREVPRDSFRRIVTRDLNRRIAPRDLFRRIVPRDRTYSMLLLTVLVLFGWGFCGVFADAEVTPADPLALPPTPNINHSKYIFD